MEEVLGLILAGGQGRRMGVLCEERPKPLLPFGGKFCVADFSLSNCINSQITRLAALTDYQRQQAAEYFNRWKQPIKGLKELSILPPESTGYKGTADAVYQNLDFISESGTDKILILAGDHIYKMDYRPMLAFHNRMKADVTVAVIQVPLPEAHRFGTVRTDASCRVEKFEEKSLNPTSSLASMGIYVFERNILIQRLREDAARTDSPHDFGYAILPGMVSRQDRVFAYEFKGYWQDIGTIKAYYETSLELLAPVPAFDVANTEWPLFSIDRAYPAPDIVKGGMVSNSLVSPGCKIEGRVENSILSPGVHVEKQAVVRNSIVMANTHVGYHSVIDSCILDENVDIGRFCYAGFSGSGLPGNWEVTVIGKEVVVPPNTGIGRSVKIQSRVRAEEFATGLVTSGSLVSSGRS